MPVWTTFYLGNKFSHESTGYRTIESIFTFKRCLCKYIFISGWKNKFGGLYNWKK